MTTPSVLIRGGRVVVPHHNDPVDADVLLSNGAIAAIGPELEPPTTGGDPIHIDARGSVVAPGLVDLHGDAFERSLMPRGGVRVDTELALVDNDQQLLASGITTSFVSATDSWEPGLRSRDTLRQLVRALDQRPAPPKLELHVRHERCNTEDFDELLGWVSSGAIRFLSYNDHTPGGIAWITGISSGQIERSCTPLEDLEQLQGVAMASRQLGYRQEEQLAEVAATHQCRTASHDADDADDLERDLRLGVAVAEFPTSVDLAAQYRDHGVAVMFGAPNLVRGASHLGNLSVREAWKAGVGDILVSDYHYPSLLQSPFCLQAEGLVGLGAAWRAVSEAPARAAGLTDRGRIEVGACADVVVVAPPAGGRPARATTVIVDGVVARAGH